MRGSGSLRRAAPLLLPVALQLTGCAPAPPAPAPATCEPREMPAVPTLRFAQGLRFEAGEGFRRVVVEQPWPGATRAFAAVLLECGATDPEGFVGEPRVRVPVERVATSAAVQVAQIEALGGLDSLVAHAGTGALWSPAARQRASEGALADLGLEGPLDLESLVAAHAVVYLANPLSAADDLSTRLAALGIVALPHAEWVEPLPLGRAEWILLTGALLGREAEASALFDQIVAGWQVVVEQTSVLERALQSRTSGLGVRPRVFTGLPWRGTWWLPGAGSATARLVEAAGGRWAFDDLEGPSNKPLDLEAVIARAFDAPVWLTPGAARSREEILALEPRATSLRALDRGLVLIPDLRIAPGGGNDWWEGAIVRPDLAVAELASWLHPSLVALDQPRWLRPLRQPPSSSPSLTPSPLPLRGPRSPIPGPSSSPLPS